MEESNEDSFGNLRIKTDKILAQIFWPNPAAIQHPIPNQRREGFGQLIRLQILGDIRFAEGSASDAGGHQIRCTLLQFFVKAVRSGRRDNRFDQILLVIEVIEDMGNQMGIVK